MGWRLRPVKLHELVNLICDQPASWSAVVILEVVIGEEGPWVGEVILYHFTNEILTKSNFVLRTAYFNGFQLDFFSLTIGTSSVAASGMRNFLGSSLHSLLEQMFVIPAYGLQSSHLRREFRYAQFTWK